MVFKTLSQDRVQQRFVQLMMLITSSGAAKSSWSTLAASTRFHLRRKRRRSRWTLRSSPHASKALSAPGATVPPWRLVVHFRARVRRAPPECAGTMVMAPVIMLREFQQSVLFFCEGAPDSVHDQSAGHSSCMQSGHACDAAAARSWLVLPVPVHFSQCSLACRQAHDVRHHVFCGFQAVAELVVDNRSGMFYVGFTGYDTPRAVFRCLLAGP